MAEARRKLGVLPFVVLRYTSFDQGRFSLVRASGCYQHRRGRFFCKAPHRNLCLRAPSLRHKEESRVGPGKFLRSKTRRAAVRPSFRVPLTERLALACWVGQRYGYRRGRQLRGLGGAVQRLSEPAAFCRGGLPTTLDRRSRPQSSSGGPEAELGGLVDSERALLILAPVRSPERLGYVPRASPDRSKRS